MSVGREDLLDEEIAAVRLAAEIVAYRRRGRIDDCDEAVARGERFEARPSPSLSAAVAAYRAAA